MTVASARVCNLVTLLRSSRTWAVQTPQDVIRNPFPDSKVVPVGIGGRRQALLYAVGLPAR